MSPIMSVQGANALGCGGWLVQCGDPGYVVLHVIAGGHESCCHHCYVI